MILLLPAVLKPSHKWFIAYVPERTKYGHFAIAQGKTQLEVLENLVGVVRLLFESYQERSVPVNLTVCRPTLLDRLLPGRTIHKIEVEF